jgi:hypothetical protein
MVKDAFAGDTDPPIGLFIGGWEETLVVRTLTSLQPRIYLANDLESVSRRWTPFHNEQCRSLNLSVPVRSPCAT